MSNRRITAPAEVITIRRSPKNPKGTPYPFSAYIRQLMADRRWGQTVERAIVARELKVLFGILDGDGSEIQAGEHRDLRLDDWQLLRECAKQPQYQPLPDGTFTAYDPEVVVDILPYIDAIIEAKPVPAHPAKPEPAA